ncbi:MAG TPA: hypothetical protein VMB81_30665 [Candidatus Sulfotelmatobacter sp.]|nr:hypothetical protein [Candidatus Sulfotelmatobacter sp.]
MAEDGYYELQVLDRAGWSLRNRFPTSADDPMVVMRARAEAEQAAQDPEVRGVELTYEFMDAKTNEVRREAVFSWGSARAAPAAGPASTASTRRQILRTARAEGRVRPRGGSPGGAAPRRGGPARPGAPEIEPPEIEPPAASDALPTSASRRGGPWWRRGWVAMLGSLVLAAGATAVIWIGLAHRIETVAAVDPRPVQAGLFTVILLFCLGVLAWVQRRGIAALMTTERAPKPAASSSAPAVIEIPEPVPPAGPRPKALAPGDAVVEIQQARLLRFLRDCLMHKDMRAAFASDNKLTDPHIVHGVHLFMLGAGEVCVTDTASGISDRAHLVKVMKALMRAIGSPEDRAEAFVSQLESYRKKPEEHTMILLGQLAMDHYLQSNQVEDGVLSKALMRWSAPNSE